MSLAHPSYLLLLTLLPLLGLGLYWAERRRGQALERLLGAGLLKRHLGPRLLRVRALQSALAALCLALGVLALAQPRSGFDWRETQSEQSQVVLAMDLSRSMDAGDVSPSRLIRAQQDALDLVRALPGDRVGLVIFAQGAYPRAPLTTDRAVLSHMVAGLQTPLLRAQGSSLAAALRQSLEILPEQGADAQAIVLISDGEDHRPKDLQAAVAMVQARGVPIFVLGVGSEKGAPIPLMTGGFKRGPDGQTIITRLDEDTLASLAQATGGSYLRSVPGPKDSQALAKDIQSALTRQLGTVERERIPRERFYVPLALAWLSLMLSTLLRDRAGSLKLPSWAQAWAAALLLLIPLGAVAQELSAWEQAQREFERGNYAAAAQIYEQLAQQGSAEEQLSAQQNQALAHYQAGQLDQALEVTEALLEQWQQDAEAAQRLEELKQEIAAREGQQQRQEQDQQDQQDQQGEPSGEPQQGEPSGEPQRGEQQDPQQGEQAPQQGEPSGEPQQPDEGSEGGQDEPDTGISEQAQGRSGQADPSQDDGTRDAQAGEAQGEPSEESGEEQGAASQAGDGQGEPEEIGPAGLTRSQAQDILDSVEEGSPRVAYGGKGGGRDW